MPRLRTLVPALALSAVAALVAPSAAFALDTPEAPLLTVALTDTTLTLDGSDAAIAVPASGERTGTLHLASTLPEGTTGAEVTLTLDGVDGPGEATLGVGGASLTAAGDTATLPTDGDLPATLTFDTPGDYTLTLDATAEVRTLDADDAATLHTDPIALAFEVAAPTPETETDSASTGSEPPAVAAEAPAETDVPERATAEDPIVLSSGNISLTPQLTNSATSADVASVVPALLDKTGGYASATWYDPTQTILHLGEAEHDAASGTWSTPAAVGDPASYAAGTGARLLLGVDAATGFDADWSDGPNTGALTRTDSLNHKYPSATLTSVSTPEGGRVTVTETGASTPAWDSAAPAQTALYLPDNASTFTGFAFTSPGRYCLTVDMSVRSYTSQKDVTGQAVYTIYVGDLPTTPAVCGTDDGTGDDGSGDDGDDTGAPAATVVSAGNISLTPKLTASTTSADIDAVEPELLDKTGGYATATWHSTTDTVLHLDDAEYDATAGTWSTPSSVDDVNSYTTGSKARLLLSADAATGFDADWNDGPNAGALTRTDNLNHKFPTTTLVSATTPDGGKVTATPAGADKPAWDSSVSAQTPIYLADTADSFTGFTFTAAGKYCLTVSMTVRSYASQKDVTGQAVYTVYVGELPATPTVCNPDDNTGDGGDNGDGDGGDNGDGGSDKDPVTVLSKGHMDVRPWMNDAGDGIVIGGNQNSNIPSKDLVMTGVREATVPEPTDDLNYTFIGKPGTAYWYFGQAAPADKLWPGFQSGFEDGELKQGSQVSITLAGVSGPGDVWLWQDTGTPTADTMMYSSVWGLPHTWGNATAFHSHNNWAFTQQGRYCLNFQATAQKADGSYVHGSGQITIWAGDASQASSVTPCDRDTTPAVGTLPALSVQQDQDGYLSDSEYDQIEPYFTSDKKLDVAIKSQKGITDPATDRDLDDVIVSVPRYVTGLGYRTGSIKLGNVRLGTDTDRIPWSSADTPIDWKLGDVKGPGTVTMRQSNDEFSTATNDLSYELPPASNSNMQAWSFSEAGVYCIPFTMTVTPKGASTPVSVSKTLTVVAGSTDPTADDYVDRSKLTTCANGQKPTSATGDDGSGDDGSGDGDVSDADVFVPNESLTDSGAVILNDGHVDVASRVDGDTLETWVKDTTETSDPRYHPLAGSNSLASNDRSDMNNGNGTVFQVLPQAETTVPTNSTYSFLGSPGSPIWQVTQTQQTDLDLLWPGWSTEDIPIPATRTGVQWTLDKTSGPGEFSLYTSDAVQIGKVDVLFNTRDGITSADSFEIAQNAHVHGTWSFSAQGTYCLAFTRSTTMADGVAASDDFVLAVAVGRVDVKRVDPGQCFSTVGQPTTTDTSPVPESQLTDATKGGVGVFDLGAIYPGGLVTAQVGSSHAGQWVSVWLDSTPTWLGWAEVSGDGTVQVRLPADAPLGDHKLVVKTSDGDLIGWDALTLTKAPDTGDGGGGQAPGDDPVFTAPTGQCTTSGLTVLTFGHMDWNAQVVGGKLESYIGDDSTGNRRYLEPSRTVLWLKPSSAVAMKAGYEQVAPAGTTLWQIPQTQNQDLVWLGWSTELLNAGNAAGPVTWSLTGVDGPGSVKVYTVGSFGGVEEMVFDGPGSHTIRLGSHVHANWAFSAQGVYRLHFTESVTLANGQRSSDSEVLTIAVGDVNPYAVGAGTGCGATGAVVRTSGLTDDAAKAAAGQADAPAATRPTSGEGTGGAGTPVLADPIRALRDGNPVPLLLTILGGLLLLGAAGTGVLWWRRRTTG